MTDIFISYAREDKEFVQHLHNELRTNGREDWVDWKDIPPTAEWMQEIRSAIEATDAFVIIVSPDSISSAVYKQEIDHAVKNNKRLIPIIRCEVSEGSIPADLAKLNWIFFRKSDDFGDSFQLLIEAIDTDLDWVRLHTRLLVRAREWENKEQDKSLLMRGGDLRDAENWLALSAEKDPKPTALHTQYVLFSRKAATKRQGIFLAAVAFALVVAITLALIAVYQAQVAEQRRQISLARQLTAQSIIHRRDQLDLSLLLSVQATRIIDGLKASGKKRVIINDSEIKNGLLGALAFSPHLITFLRGHRSTIWSVEFSPDGQMLASAGLDGDVFLWNPATHERVIVPLTGDANNVAAVAFSPAENIVAAAVCKEPHPKWGGVCHGAIQLWDLPTLEPIKPELTGHAWNVTAIAFSPDGRTPASGGGWKDHSVILWDLDSRQPIASPLRGHSNNVTSLAFSHDGQMFASSSLDGTIILWDMATRAPLGRLRNGRSRPIWSVAFSSDGKLLASGNANGTVTLWDISSRQPLGKPLAAHSGEVRCVTFAPDGRTLASASRDNTILLWDVATHHSIGDPLIGHTEDIFSVAFAPDGRTLASAGVNAELILWDLEKAQPLGESLKGHSASVESLVFTPDGRTLASGDKAGNVILWDVGRRVQLGNPITGHRGAVSGMAFTAHGGELISSSADGSVNRWDFATRQLLGRSAIKGARGAKCTAVSENGKIVASAFPGNRIKLWNVADKQPVGEPLTGHIAGIESLAFHPDGQLLASGGKDGIRLWDVRRHEHLKSLTPRFGGSVFDLKFIPDGSTLAAAALGGIQFWNTSTGQPIGEPLTAHGPLAAEIAFNPDGRSFATGSLFKRGNILPTIQLWDLATRQPVGPPLKAHTRSVKSLAYSPGGELLASSGEDNTVILWDVNVKSWQRRACEIVNRSLTKEEWKYYLSDEPYNDGCLRNSTGPVPNQ